MAARTSPGRVPDSDGPRETDAQRHARQYRELRELHAVELARAWAQGQSAGYAAGLAAGLLLGRYPSGRPRGRKVRSL